MNKFVKKYKKARCAFDAEKKIYNGRCMICETITDENKRQKEVEKCESDYLAAEFIFDAVVSELNNEIIRCGYLIRYNYNTILKALSVELMHISGIESDERTLIIDDSIKATIDDKKGLVKYERIHPYSWNVCYAIDADFDICAKKTFNKWIKSIKDEFDKNIG